MTRLQRGIVDFLHGDAWLDRYSLAHFTVTAFRVSRLIDRHIATIW
ncbi:MAG: hypothetical protein MK171_06390 [Pirellulales bacterium]|nr:hypothetical protein [Pirellulales bacterium]